VASSAAIIIICNNNNIQFVNPAALTLLNIDDITNLPESVSDLPSPWNTELSKLNETDTLIIHLNGINQFKCYKSYFIDRGVKQAFFIIEGLTKELLNAERQSYEKIIKMMSHEVNNSVGAVNSIIDSTIHYMEIQKDTDYKDYISVLNVASERNNNLNLFTNRFAEIVRIPPPVISKCDLKEVVNQVLILFQPEFEKKGIRTKTQYHSDQTLIAFDYQQLELVLINIIKNAVQAIQVNGEITLIFKTQPSSLIVENTGEPIPETVQKRLFESFFTTKKEGQGIGLTLIREILTNHRYDFSLKTRGDGITEFQIVFN